jgi:hypothetical protein
MAGSVLKSRSVFQMNFGAKLKASASKSATSPSCKTLWLILTEQKENLTLFKPTTA